MQLVLILPQTSFRKGHIYGYVRAAVLPLGLAMLGAVMEREGHRVTVWDLQLSDFSPDPLNHLLREADMVGISRQTIVSIEKGDYAPSVKLALLLAEKLKTTVEQLFILEDKDHA